MTALTLVRSIVVFLFACQVLVSGRPVGINSLRAASKLDEKRDSNYDTAELSFQQFIQKQPDSTVIAEFKPNSSDLEILRLRNKIADTIANMKESQGVQLNKSLDSAQNECYIEVTKVERIAGRCIKVGGGLPVCQSNNYMAINQECN